MSLNNSTLSNLIIDNSSNINNSPSSYGNLTWSLYLRLVFAALGILANLVNIIVFMNSRLQDVAYKYMLATSATNFVFLSIHFAIVFLNSCIHCPSSESYTAAILSILLGFYLQNCMAVLRLFFEIMISLRIYFILLNKSFERVSYKIILLLLAILSLVYYIQQPFSYTIAYSKKWDNTISYSVKATSFGNSAAAKWLMVSQFSVRIFLTMIVLCLINILSVIEFRRRTARVSFQQPTLSTIKNHKKETDQSNENDSITTINKSKKSNKNKKKKFKKQKSLHCKCTINLTRMVIFSSFANIIGMVPYSITYILYRTVYNNTQTNFVFDIGLILMYISLDVDIVVYYCFNSKFREVLKDYFKRVYVFLKNVLQI